MTSGERFDLVVWGKGVRLEGFRPSEVDELFEWFAGGIDLVDDQRVPSLVVRMVRSPASAPTGLRSTIRHRGGISEKKYFLDGSHFEQTSQIRDVDIVFESPGLCCYGVDGALLVTTREVVLVVATEPPPMLLADLVENWLLCCAREDSAVMAHGSGWIRDGAVEI